jgi:hypothetical protein
VTIRREAGSGDGHENHERGDGSMHVSSCDPEPYSVSTPIV